MISDALGFLASNDQPPTWDLIEAGQVYVSHQLEFFVFRDFGKSAVHNLSTQWYASTDICMNLDGLERDSKALSGRGSHRQPYQLFDAIDKSIVY